VCANRSLVQDGVCDTFIKRLAETAGAMKVADGFEPGAVIGPLMDMKAVEKVEAHIADAVKKGAQVVTGGKRAAQAGSFFQPTVLTDVTTDMVITKEETFGPVAPLYRFKTEAEAIRMANEAPTLPSPACGGGEGGGSLPISTAATSAASDASRRLPNTASSASTRASSRRNHWRDRPQNTARLRPSTSAPGNFSASVTLITPGAGSESVDSCSLRVARLRPREDRLAP
jgi:Aldehyde dehydrogenase family